MKIVIDARIIYTSTGRYVERLLEHLQDIDQANQYVVLLLKKDLPKWQPKSPNFTKVEADFPIYSIREQIQLAILLYKLRPNLVHFTMPQQPVLYFGRHITTVHDLTLVENLNKRKHGLLKNIYKNHFKPLVFKIALRWFIRSSRFVITPTHFVKDHLVSILGAKEDKLVVTYESVEALAAKPQQPDFINETDQFIMFLGNAYPYKNVWRLIEAFHALGRPGLKLVLVGKKDFFYEELERRAVAAGIDGVVFAGFVPDEGTAWLNHHAQAFITASLSEGFCLPGLEAMYYGTPVLSSNASCLPEVYGPAADYFNPLDVADITRAIGGLLDSPTRQAELRAAGPEWIKRYSWEKMARETLAVYRAASKN
jgi:glycosyltransferase involved in cell wall biosynthesis